jgi:hypothetical protein
MPGLSEDLRIGPMLDGLSKRYLGDDYGNKTAAAGEVTVDMIDTVSTVQCSLLTLSSM